MWLVCLSHTRPIVPRSLPWELFCSVLCHLRQPWLGFGKPVQLYHPSQPALSSPHLHYSSYRAPRIHRVDLYPACQARSPPSSSGDMSLPMSARPIPAKIVRQIQSGQYVEMQDLLDDNMAVRRHFEDLHGAMGMQLLPITSRPRVREVSTLPVWVSCFLTYLAIGTVDPVTWDRLAYATLLIQEAMRHGGQSWIKYNRLFRQQAALNPNLPWNTIHPGLHASTILGQRQLGPGTFRTLCQGCDHTATL